MTASPTRVPEMPVVQQRQNDAQAQFPGWEPFLPQLVHPTKVAIVEALTYIGEPLSAVQLGKVLGDVGGGFRESNVRYHLNHLAEIGALEVDPQNAQRTADSKQKFFYFADRLA